MKKQISDFDQLFNAVKSKIIKDSKELFIRFYQYSIDPHLPLLERSIEKFRSDLAFNFEEDHLRIEDGSTEEIKEEYKKYLLNSQIGKDLVFPFIYNIKQSLHHHDISVAEDVVLDYCESAFFYEYYRNRLKEINSFNKKTTKPKLTSPAISLFCRLVNESACIPKKANESVEVYTKNVCSNFGLKYTNRVRINFSNRSTDKNLDIVKLLILPFIDFKTKARIEAHLIKKIDTKQKLFN